MTWLAPWALAAGALGLAGVLAAHLLSRQRPRALALATARFLPAGMLEATTLQRTPMDRWWMALRMLILALLAAGVAQPIITAARVPSRTVLLLDRTLPEAAQRAALATLSPIDAVIAFDTVANIAAPRSAVVAVSSHASMSAAFARLARVRDSLADGTTRLRVTMASRYAARSFDPASEQIRTLVSDSIAVLPVAVAGDSIPSRRGIVVRADADDAIAALATLMGDSAISADAIIERGDRLTADDSASARNGATVLWWPAREARADSRSEAITVGTRTWIAPMMRDSLSVSADARAVGWWSDGSVAVSSATLGAGWLLTMRAALPTAGDQTLSLSAQAWLAALLSTCVRPPSVVATPPDWLAAPTQRQGALATRVIQTSRYAPWLVGAALLLAALELALRARVRR